MTRTPTFRALMLGSALLLMMTGCGSTPESPSTSSVPSPEVFPSAPVPVTTPAGPSHVSLPSYADSEHQVSAGEHQVPAESDDHGGGPGTMATARFEDHVVPVLKQHCASCHSPGGPAPARYTFFNKAGEADYQVVKTNVARILLAIEAGRMPKGNPEALTSREFETLKAWFHRGSPND